MVKSTIRNLIVDRLGIVTNVDADVLARRLDAKDPASKKVSAGKEAIKIVSDCIGSKRDFSVETTLAGRNAIRQIKQAKENGFEVTMFYVGLGDVNLNIERVAARVRNGGHDIPREDIIRRHVTSLQNLLSNLDMIDNLIVIDNSNLDGEVILEAYKGRIEYVSNRLPDWGQQIAHQLENQVCPVNLDR